VRAKYKESSLGIRWYTCKRALGKSIYVTPTAHNHAVTALSTGENYTYDANGNMTQRVEGGLTYNQTFDAENRLISVSVSPSGQTTQFIYDGDGNLVKKVKRDNSKTIYPSTSLRAGSGGIYEVDKTSGGAVIYWESIQKRLKINWQDSK
jgi:YD repeat-containing protein